MLQKIETHLILQKHSFEVVIYEKFSIVGDKNLKDLCFDPIPSLQSPFLLDVVVLEIEFADEVENLKFGALQFFLTSPEPFYGE
jgi:hypothetical protein